MNVIEENYVRIILALELHVKTALIEVIYNVNNKFGNYVGLPSNEVDLYNSMCQFIQNNQRILNKILNEDQWILLRPPSQKCSPKDWDITLLIVVIRNKLKIKPQGGWEIQNVDPNDTSLGAFIFMVKQLRNEVKHGTIKKIGSNFERYWERIKNLLRGLQYIYMDDFHDLKSRSLDSNLPVIQRILKDLENDVSNLSDVASDNSKEILHCKEKINHLSNSKADKSDLELAMQRQNLELQTAIQG